LSIFHYKARASGATGGGLGGLEVAISGAARGNPTPNPFPCGKGNNRAEVALEVVQFFAIENGQNDQFLPYVVVFGRRGSTDSFVLSKIVFGLDAGCAILGLAGECEAR
jgi:hypothetical protein